MKALRILGLAFGLASALGVLGTRRALAGYAARLRAETPASAAPPTAGPAPGRAVARVRVVVGALGLLAVLTGVWKVLHVVQPASYLWLVIWLGGAIILHDALLVPVLSLLRAGAHRVLRPLPEGALALVKGGFVVGGLLVLVVVPEIWAQHLGPLNPTVLPGDYGRRLLLTLAVIAVLTTAGAAVLRLRSRNRPRRPGAVSPVRG